MVVVACSSPVTGHHHHRYHYHCLLSRIGCTVPPFICADVMSMDRLFHDVAFFCFASLCFALATGRKTLGVRF